MLAEEFLVSPTFARWFLWNTKFKTAEYLVQDVAVSQSSTAGESDLIITYVDKDGARFGIFIEDKVDARFQPDQLRRYHARAQTAVQTGWFAHYDVVLCAPRGYYELSPKAKEVASFVSYEAIADQLSKALDGSPSQVLLGQQYRACFLRTAATRAANRWERVDDPETNLFWSAAYQLASSSFPALEMKEPKYSKGTAWITFRPHWMPTQPRQVRVELKRKARVPATKQRAGRFHFTAAFDGKGSLRPNFAPHALKRGPK